MTTIDCKPEEFYRFNCPKLGYSILLVPHSKKDRGKLTREAKEKGMSLKDFARDETTKRRNRGHDGNRQIPGLIIETVRQFVKTP